MIFFNFFEKGNNKSMGSQLSFFTESEGLQERLKYEYFFVISPDNIIKKEVELLKAKLDVKIGLSDENRFSKPHISLFKWPAKNNVDHKIIQFAEKMLRETKTFNIPLNGLDIY